MCENNTDYVHIFNVDFLNNFQSESGKILPKSATGVCSKHQRLIARIIKRARVIGLVL